MTSGLSFDVGKKLIDFSCPQVPHSVWSARTEAPCVRPSFDWSWRTSGSSACGTSSRRPTAARTGLSSFWPAAMFEPKKRPRSRRTAAKTKSETRIVLWHSSGRSEGDLLAIQSAPQADKSPPLHGFPLRLYYHSALCLARDWTLLLRNTLLWERKHSWDWNLFVLLLCIPQKWTLPDQWCDYMKIVCVHGHLTVRPVLGVLVYLRVLMGDPREVARKG